MRRDREKLVALAHGGARLLIEGRVVDGQRRAPRQLLRELQLQRPEPSRPLRAEGQRADHLIARLQRHDHSGVAADCSNQLSVLGIDGVLEQEFVRHVRE